MKPFIKTIKYRESFISFSPERGGLITQININGQDILFLNEESFFDLSKNVRGGIPVLFPNAGPLFNDKIYKLSQHGFARNSVFNSNILNNILEMTLVSNDDTKKVFDFDFEFKIFAEFITDGIKITQKIINIGDKNLPISSGFHPYFFIEDKFKPDLKIKGYKDNYFDIWSTGDTKYLSKVHNLEFQFKNYSLEFNYDKNYEEIWLRSEPGKNFLCIEPSLKPENGLVDNPIIIKPKESREFSFEIKLKKES